MLSSFYTVEELRNLGFKSLGTDVFISRKASIYGASRIEIGSRVRIDDFCVLSGKIKIGNNVHIAVYSALFGGDAGITLNDFSNISSRICIYALSDDFSGNTMTNPTISNEYKNVIQQPVYIGKHVIIGTGSTVLMGVTIGDGSAVGAMSLVKTSVEPWTICVGIPAKTIGKREKKILELERKYLNEQN